MNGDVVNGVNGVHGDVVNVPILMYHSIRRDRDHVTSPFMVAESVFARQLELLSAGGYTSITVGDLLAGRAGERSVLITMDDGYLDNYELAFPLLQRFRFGACIFAVSDFLRRRNWWDADLLGGAPLLEPRHMREMLAAGIEFGAHGVTHRSLVALDADARRTELVDGRRALEDALSAPVTCFAYPYGDVDAAAKEAVRAAGYRAAFAVNTGPLLVRDDVLHIRRVRVTSRRHAFYMACKLRMEKRLRCSAASARVSLRAALHAARVQLLSGEP